VDIKRALGYTEAEARRELAMWLGHNPHRTEVTYAYVPRANFNTTRTHITPSENDFEQAVKWLVSDHVPLGF